MATGQNGKYANQRRMHAYLLDKFKTQNIFTRAEIKAASEFSDRSFDTYWSKQLVPLLVHAGNAFRVSEAFRPYATWAQFHRHIASQVRRVSSQYTLSSYSNLMVFEFFMPLTNEGHLRTALDALFYRDTVLARLRSVDHARLTQHLPRESDESSDAYFARVCDWIQERFGGYSISHVGGRFRADALRSLSEAARAQENLERYIVDETTAIVRFIFPCGRPVVRKPPLSPEHFESFDDVGAGSDAVMEAERIRWFFGVLFVQSIVQVVNGEDEIWMVESGMQHRLHRWRVEPDTTGSAPLGGT